MEKTRFINRKTKKISNVVVVIFLIIFFVGYLFFFLSPYFMVGVGSMNYTNFSEVLTIENHDIQILNWSYSKKQQRMEVELSVNNRNFDGRNEYIFSAAFRPTNKAVDIEIVLSEPNYIVLQINNVPKRWQEISLRMKIAENGLEELKMYSNKDQISYVDDIQVLSELDYHLRQLERSISNYTKSIEDIDSQIQELYTKIQNIKDTNVQLEENKKYQTSVEIENTNQQIQANEDSIIEIEKQVESLKKEKAEYQNQILQAEERLKELQK